MLLASHLVQSDEQINAFCTSFTAARSSKYEGGQRDAGGVQHRGNDVLRNFEE
jgi:hypothetical protein